MSKITDIFGNEVFSVIRNLNRYWQSKTVILCLLLCQIMQHITVNTIISIIPFELLISLFLWSLLFNALIDTLDAKKIFYNLPQYIPRRLIVLFASTDWLVWKWLARTIHLWAAEETTSWINNLIFLTIFRYID